MRYRMADFLKIILDMNVDGTLSLKEGLLAAGLAAAVILAAVFVVLRLLERSHIRKTSIFRVKKNKYKSRLGKKNIKY